MRALTRISLSTWIVIGVVLVFEGYTTARKPNQLATPTSSAQGYEPSSTCRGCHDTIVAQHFLSEHEKSFTNPTFQAQYRQDLLRKSETDPGLNAEARECISCHEPISYATQGPRIISLQEVNPNMNGVTCDVCHTMTGYRSPKPQNGNYIIAPSGTKFGPFKEEGDWHHVYSELQTKSEICAVCHEAVNRHGFQIKSTYTEWRESVFGKIGISCQDCHMNVNGFLTGGEPRFSSGKAANMSLGKAPERTRLYTHQFPGSHSKTQVEGAIELSIKATPMDASQSRTMMIEVTVDNSRTGHSMPSGSADLRLLWLEVAVHIGDRVLILPVGTEVPAVNTDLSSHSIAGYGNFDSLLIGQEIPKGSRVYRAIFTDAKGQATLNSYDAVAKLFDNRLKAAEKRREFYPCTIPEGAKSDFSIEAVLKYLPCSSTFTDQLGLPKPEVVIVARKKIELGAR
jgi:hypothetical protein